MSRSFYLFFIAWMLLVVGCRQQESSPSGKPSFFTELSSVAALRFTVTADLSTLISNKEEEDYYPATLHSQDPSFPFNNRSILIKTRGETRKEVCDFPPLMLKMPDDSLEHYGLSAFDKIKLVTHCMDSLYFEQLVIKEYLNYKLFNLITDSSFRVHRAMVTYRDLGGLMQETTKQAFLIEPEEEMAHRLGCKLDESDAPISNVDGDHYQKLVLFQYMIGNTDWSLSNRHNIRILVPKAGAPIPVPYDFDFSGLVNAPYASPHPILPIKKVTERLFQWRGAEDHDFSAYVSFYNDKKEAILNLCTYTAGLNEQEASQTAGFIESFYDGIDTPEKIKKAIAQGRD